MRLVWDIESSGLLDHTTIDYCASPYRLKDSFTIHCIVAVDIDSGDVYRFVGEEVKTDFPKLMEKATTLVGHNQIDFDLPAIKLYLGIEYTIGEQCTFMGKDVEIIDTLVLSKVLNPDRYKGHSLDEWGQRLGIEKIDWRAKAIELGLCTHGSPRGAEFAQYHPEMLVYNERDCVVNVKLYHYLVDEMGDHPWHDAFVLEQMVRDIVTRQGHRGFFFNSVLAGENIRDLDEKMESIRATVEPLLPPKLMGKTKTKEYLPPKIQFKKNGELSENIKKWVAKHDGWIKELDDGTFVAHIFNVEWKLPLSQEVPVKTHEPATVKDTTHIKGWLVELGWKPTQYKERDLTCDTKKQKHTPEKFQETVKRYVEQTLSSPFCRDRCDELDTSPARLLQRLLKHDLKRPLKVYTNPTITVGMEKEIDPALLELADEFPHAKLVSEYLTYAHRRNSILGGGVDPDDWDDRDEEDDYAGKGFLAAERIQEDGRIQTPADTCGAGTSRFKHRLVANIPRVTSLYGDRMRGLFGVDVADGFYQLGYDFDSLEARIEAHYVYKYPGGPEYGVSLTAMKPHDCHTVLATKISELIGRAFPRSSAKNVKYGCLPVDNTEVLTEVGWKRQEDVSVGDAVLGFDCESRTMDWTCVRAKQFYVDADVGLVGNKRWSVEATEDHKWLSATGYTSDVVEPTYTFDLQSNSRILNAAPLRDSGITQNDAALVGWLLSDGYWKWSEAGPCRQNKSGSKLGVIASVGQSTKKFCEDVQGALEMADVRYTVYDSAKNMREFRINADDFRDVATRNGFYGKAKTDVDWDRYVLSLGDIARKNFIIAFWLADGRQVSKESATIIRQRPGNIANAVALAMALDGRKTTLRVDSENMATINGSLSSFTGFQTGSYIPTRKTDVFCLTTDCGSFFIRQGGVLTLTGNCSYNAQPARVAKTVGCDPATGKVIFDAFWDLAKPLEELKLNMQDFWETTGGKKWLLGLDKRKLPIRNKGNVINTAFQSAGVICAKRAMVLHEQMLREEGLIVDFFRENWKEKDFCQQLIAYHDEAQLEVRRGQVTWKRFDDEAACKAFEADDGKVWSEPVHNDKGWFRGYCRAGELATIAVTLAGQYYKLNVPLTAGYCLGRSWAECH